MTALKALVRPSGLFSSSQGDMVEAAVTMPLLLLVTFALVGHARNSAQNAANHGARVGAVTASGAGSAARQEAERLMANCFCTYSVTVNAANAPGSTVTVAVAWTVPSYVDGFLQVMGGSAQGDFSGTVSASHRKEGW